jgi:hypothetical protein
MTDMKPKVLSNTQYITVPAVTRGVQVVSLERTTQYKIGLW